MKNNMLAIKLLIGAIVLTGFGYMLRRPPRGFWRGALGFTVMFSGTAFGINTITKQAGIVREDAYARIAAHALQQVQGNTLPYLLFVGASYSRNGLDDRLLSQKLQDRGYRVQVINFALEGASLQERDLRLKQFMQAAPRPPEMVFFEISERFDTNPVYGFEVAKFSNRVIGQFDAAGTLWAIKGMAEQKSERGFGSLAKNSILLGLHAPVNLTNIGLIAGGGTLSSLSANPAFDPQDTARSEVTGRDRNFGLLAPIEIQEHAAPVWATEFRKQQANWLKKNGVLRIGYYFPPVIDAHERAYIAARCREYTYCIAPDDLTLLAQLDKDIWFDAEHLLADGARIYTNWMSTQLERQGALGPISPERKLALELRR